MNGPSFVVERFGWGAPDRLEVAGTFSGLTSETPAEAVLTVVGEDGPHRLPAIGDGDGHPSDGARWKAEFAWLEAPVAFDRARLELGASLAVELPAPDTATAGEEIAVELLDEAAESEPHEHEAGAGGDERSRLETRLLEQFREGLAQVRGSAEVALEAAEIELAEARSELSAVRGELDAVRGERDVARGQLDAMRGELDAARGVMAAAQTDAQALVERLSGRR